MSLMASKKNTGGAPNNPPPPNQTLYVQNLPEKLQKYDLRRALYMLFSAYGPVLDIVALKTTKMRGQAHVTFRDVPSATQAMKHCQGFEFFGKKMSIDYARSRSHAIAKLTGTFTDPNTQSAKPAPEQPQGQAPSSFPLPPGVSSGPPKGLPPPPGLPKPPNGLQAPAHSVPQDTPSPSGTKRLREESDDGEGEPMEEDDSGGEMEMSDDD